MKPLAERFWSKVDKRGPSECWLWTGGRSRGYGAITVGSRKDGSRTPMNAHRVAWELASGRKLRDGYVIAHAPGVCHNRLCCNPAHLRETTHLANQHDRWADGTHNRGSRHGNSLLTEADVVAIREARERGLTLRQIQKLWPAALPTLSQIINRKRWRHV